MNSGEKAAGDAVVAGDTLVVTSQTGTQTRYVIATVALSSDNLLVATDGSGITVDVAGVTGSVGGFDFGTSLRAVLDLLTVPDLAVLNIIDAGGNLVPLQRRDAQGELVDVSASADYSFEVVAENGDIVTYALAPGVLASDAYVLSDVYAVTEDAGQADFQHHGWNHCFIIFSQPGSCSGSNPEGVDQIRTGKGDWGTEP